ncbi:MAG: hypothetical protein RMY34_31110 [Aulosira sp. DedQUE10]|nr:hypothetical protein [Aulosira sp. DedQUE10]
MTRVFSWIQNVLLRRIAIVLLLGLAFLGMQFSGYSNGMQAQADTVKTPEGIYYKGTPDNVGNTSNDKNLLNKAVDNLKSNSGDNVRRNFNDDRGYSENKGYSDNRGYSNNRGNIGETVKTPEGTYYKGTPDNNLIENSKNTIKEGADHIREKLNLK